ACVTMSQGESNPSELAMRPRRKVEVQIGCSLMTVYLPYRGNKHGSATVWIALCNGCSRVLDVRRVGKEAHITTNTLKEVQGSNLATTIGVILSKSLLASFILVVIHI